jgi:hypothetical protein
MKIHLLLILTIIAALKISGQQKKELSIKYNGLPFTLLSSSEGCIESISLNNVAILDSTFGKIVTLNLDKLGYEKYDNIFIQIVHSNDCSVNPILPNIKSKYCLKPDSLFLTDSTSTLTWTAKEQTVAELFIVERLFNGEWTKIAGFSGFEETYTYEIPEDKLLVGKNEFRIRTREQLINHNCSSNTVEIIKEKEKLVEMKFDNNTKILTFSSPTDFYIIDSKQHAMVIKKNQDSYDLSKFPKGKYQVKFNNNKGLEPILIKKPGVLKQK